MMKWIKGIAAVLSLFLFFIVAGLTFIVIVIDNFLGSIVNFISKKLK